MLFDLLLAASDLADGDENRCDQVLLGELFYFGHHCCAEHMSDSGFAMLLSCEARLISHALHQPFDIIH